MSTTLRFRFVPEKLVAAIAYFAQRGVPKLDKLKTLKLLFFADKEHLLKHGRPILGDVYFSMPQGPVPSFSKNMIDDTLEPEPDDAEKGLLKYVRVDKQDGHKYRIFVSRKPADLDQLSSSEREVLDHTIEKYGNLDPWPLRNLTHRELCWKISDESKREGVLSVPMPYELFFKGQGASAEEMLELAREEQEDRDLVATFFK